MVANPAAADLPFKRFDDLAMNSSVTNAVSIQCPRQGGVPTAGALTGRNQSDARFIKRAPAFGARVTRRAGLAPIIRREHDSDGCCGLVELVVQNPPQLRGIAFHLRIYRSSRIRMIRGIGIPTSQRRIGMGCSFRGYKLAAGLAAPCTVAKASAFGRGEACAERTDQQR